jgi:hypothetical protein
MSKFRIFYFLFILIVLFLNKTALAVCPVCTVAVGAGVGLARYIGVDDTIAGIWIGGLLVSLILWTLSFFDKKKIFFWGRWLVTTIVYLLLIVVPLVWLDILGHPLNKLWGIDKLLLGIFSGSIVFIFANFFYQWLKNKNGGKPYFPFQKVVMPILSLLILSFIFYFITK